jgi:hypothetical protein
MNEALHDILCYNCTILFSQRGMAHRKRHYHVFNISPPYGYLGSSIPPFTPSPLSNLGLNFGIL